MQICTCVPKNEENSLVPKWLKEADSEQNMELPKSLWLSQWPGTSTNLECQHEVRIHDQSICASANYWSHWNCGTVCYFSKYSTELVALTSKFEVQYTFCIISTEARHTW